MRQHKCVGLSACDRALLARAGGYEHSLCVSVFVVMCKSGGSRGGVLDGISASLCAHGSACRHLCVCARRVAFPPLKLEEG